MLTTSPFSTSFLRVVTSAAAAQTLRSKKARATRQAGMGYLTRVVPDERAEWMIAERGRGRPGKLAAAAPRWLSARSSRSANRETTDAGRTHLKAFLESSLK